MKLKVNLWEEDLYIGNIGEKFIENNFLTVFKPILVNYLYSNRYKFELNELIQKAGIDGKTALSLFKWEVKTRTRFYPDILLETHHDKNFGNNVGWFFLSEADIIAYLYLDKNKVVEKGFLLIMNKLRDYFSKEVLNKYPEIKAPNKNYISYNRAVPFKAFPPNSLISIPKIKNTVKTNKQKDISDFLINKNESD